MNDLIDKLWPAFEAEVSEQLDQLEQVLARGNLDVDIHFLFRQFHTIKSSSAMMDFGGMEAVAHAAEDLLDLVRKGQRPFDDELLEVLLRAVDALRRQMSSAMQERRPPAPEEALVADLHALRGAPPVAAAPNTAPEVPPVNALQDAVEAYAALARDTLPQLAMACVDGGEWPALGALLAQQAESAGLLAISRLLEKAAAVAPASRLAVLDDLLTRQRHIESLSTLDAGCRSTEDLLRTLLAPEFRNSLDAAGRVGESPLTNQDDAERWLHEAQNLQRHCRLLGLPASQRLLSLVTQVLRELARGTLIASPALGTHLLLGLTLPSELAQGLIEDAPYTALADQLLDNIQHTLHATAQNAPGAEPAPAPTIPGLSPERLATLSADAQAQLSAALAAGQTLVEIDADLDLAGDGGEAFVSWMTNTGTMIANHTVFLGEGANESTQLRFLVALPLPADAIALALAQLDPDGAVLNLHVLNGAQPASKPQELPLSSKPEVRPQTGSNSTVRIDSQALDNFVNRVGELVMLRNTMAHGVSNTEVSTGLRLLQRFFSSTHAPSAAEKQQMQRLVGRLAAYHEQWQQTDTHLQDTLGRLQDDVLALRVVPVSAVFNRMTRIARSLAQAQEKNLHIDCRGEETRIDKGMVDLLVEPLTHMVRNAIDHGLESEGERLAAGKPAAATLTLSAAQQGNNLLITIADDGRGLDLARILAKARRLGLAGEQFYSEDDITQFIFAPGFSTSEQVTAVSGRGVGMDVVKTRITQIGGQIEVSSVPGEGTRFTLRLPLSVAIQNIILVQAGGRLQALPERHVSEVIRLPASAVQTIQGQAACLLRGVVLPLYGLAQLLGSKTQEAAGEELDIIILSDGRHRIGLLVDHIIGRHEVFVRDVHPDILRLPGVGGASILGDGRVVIILDADSLLDLARRNAQNLQTLLSLA